MKATLSICWLLASCASAPTAPTLHLPPRALTTPTSALLTHLADRPLAAREALVLEQFERGNVPPFLATLVPIHLHAQIDGNDHHATVWCTPDYFGLGSNEDWLRMPITPQLAQHLADRLDCVLPTSHLVDAIWQQATSKVEPHPFHPRDHDILSVRLFADHHVAIERQRGNAPRTSLLAGCKKDVVLSALLRDWPTRVVIYGWHHLDGRAIQPRSKAHTTPHVDYSHGIRFVARSMLLDGEPTTIDIVLAHASLHVLLSDEGPIAPARYPLKKG